MDLLFKNIPIGITAYELAQFIQSIFNDIDGKAIHISNSSIEMLEIQDNFTHPIEQFAVVRVSSSDIAKKIIKHLDGCVIKQYQMTVREYFIRSTKNDPRLKTINSSKVFLEKRKKR